MSTMTDLTSKAYRHTKFISWVQSRQKSHEVYMLSVFNFSRVHSQKSLARYDLPLNCRTILQATGPMLDMKRWVRFKTSSLGKPRSISNYLVPPHLGMTNTSTPQTAAPSSKVSHAISAEVFCSPITPAY